MKTSHLALFIASLLFVGCAGSSSGNDDSVAPVVKALLGQWAVTPSEAWAARLDQGGANETNTNFALTYKFSDNSTVICSTAALDGDENSGTFTATGCVANPSSSSMAATVGASTFDTGGAGTYSNSNGVLQLCKHNTSCISYH